MYNRHHDTSFIVSPDPRDQIAASRAACPWEDQDVALLIVSKQITHIALVLPKRAADRGEHHVRVPPQVEIGYEQTYLCAARDIASKLVQSPIRDDQFQFIGTARGNMRRSGRIEPYGKWVHWVALQLNETHGELRSTAQQFQQAYWWQTNQILATKQVIMSERKYQMMMEALARLNELGADGQLTRRAKAQVAA